MMKSLMPLNREFYLQPSLDVAQQLIGKILVFNAHTAIITETEAYLGAEDPASHAFRGRTKRTEVMFEQGGYSYVYFIYGMYYCLNFVTGEKDVASAVLIRGVKLLTPEIKYINGPGKLCKILGITKEQNAIDTVSSNILFVAENNLTLPYIATPRIGISKAQEKFWRFIADTF